MFLGFGYLCKFVFVCMSFLLFFFFFLFPKAESNRLKKEPVSQKFRNIIFFCLLKIRLAGPVDQHINVVSPKYIFEFNNGQTSRNV